MQLDPSIFVGRTLYEFEPGDPGNYRRPAWAQLGPDGWWRSTWAGNLRMRWDDYLSLPPVQRPP